MKPLKLCACCGHPLPDGGVIAALTPSQQRIFRAVHRAGRAGISRHDVFDMVYGDRADGGPENLNILNVVRHHMKPKLAQFGLKIKSTRGRYAVWTVDPYSE